MTTGQIIADKIYELLRKNGYRTTPNNMAIIRNFHYNDPQDSPLEELIDRFKFDLEK